MFFLTFFNPFPSRSSCKPAQNIEAAGEVRIDQRDDSAGYAGQKLRLDLSSVITDSVGKMIDTDAKINSGTRSRRRPLSRSSARTSRAKWGSSWWARARPATTPACASA